MRELKEKEPLTGKILKITKKMDQGKQKYMAEQNGNGKSLAN